MAYVVFLIVSTSYLLFLSNLTGKVKFFFSYMIMTLPVLYYWTFLIGGQYDVGSDYFSYYEMFLQGAALNSQERKGEFAWIYLLQLCKTFGIEGQGIFFVIASISAFTVMYVIYKLSSKHHYIFWFVFITCAPIFHNQMNGIRQALSSFIGSCAIVLLCESNIAFACVLFFLASYIHHSYMFFIAIAYFITIMPRYKGRYLKSFLLLGVLFAFMPVNGLIESCITIYSPIRRYLDDAKWLQPIDLVNKFSRFIFLPLFWMAVTKINSMKLSASQRRLFNVGILLYATRLASLSSEIFFRIGWGCEVLMCAPIGYLMQYYKNKSTIIGLIAIFILAYYLSKVIFYAHGEYSYASYFLRQFQNL